MFIESLIRFSVRNKFVIGLLTLGLIAWGIWALRQLPIDAVPDITNNQVQVVTVSPTLAPQEVEQYITVPVELQLANLPGVDEIRSVSKFGLSVITVVFDEDVPVLDSRQLVNEQLPIAAEEIPNGLGTPRMMPITTGLGEIFQYVLVAEPGYETEYDAMELRTIQDWIVKRYLNGIEGVVEISSFGGFVRQYEVAVFPDRLRALDVTIPEVEEALLRDNQNVGSAYIEQNGRSFYIRGEGRLRTAEEIGEVLIHNQHGIPVKVRDIAEVRDGYPPRYGAMTRNGEGEAVGGITLMLKGANSDAVISAVKERIEGIQDVLPEGVDIHPYLDRSELVSRTTATVTKNLVEGGLIVIFVLVLLLGNLRAGLIVASVIPLSLLFAFGMMHVFGVSANLMSLGAIDFGLIVDGAVIIVEATVHRLQHRFAGQHLLRQEMDSAVVEATSRILKSAAFGVIIILMVYMPLLGLEGVEGKMFIPMAQTVSFAILGALILSLTYVPMVTSLVLSRSPRQKRTFSDRLVDFFHGLYEPVLKASLNRRWLVLGIAGIALVGSMLVFTRLGGEFIPQLEEGDLAMQMSLPPGSSLSQSVKMSTEAERLLLANFSDEIREVVSKIGTAEVPTDPMGVEDADIMIILHPKDHWTKALDRYDLVAQMEQVLNPLESTGTSFEFTQPIELRFNELLTGSKSDIAIKIFGEDLEELSRIGQEAVPLIEQVPGAGDVKMSRTEGFPQLMVSYRRDRMSALGLRVADVNATVKAAFAGVNAGMILEGDRRFDLAVRLHPDYRLEADELETLRLRRDDGTTIPLSEVADIQYTEGPMLINRDNTRRQVSIGVNVRGRDVEQLVNDIEQKLNAGLKLPPGYALYFGGEFEQLQSARARLAITVPLVLFLIFAMLYFTFGSFTQALMIFSAIPLAAIGGILSLWLRGMPFSISAGVGFIALFGVAVLNGIVLIGYLNQLEEEGWEELWPRILEAAKGRFRPVIMTALVASMGFLPMAISSGAGAEVQRPLATVVIGGLITATVLTLIVLPVLYSFQSRRRKKTMPGKAVAVLLVLFLSGGGLFAQGDVLTESEAIELARTQAPEVARYQAGRKTIEAGRKSLWDPGETSFQWQQGQMNTEKNDAYISVQQPLGRPWAVGARRDHLDYRLQTNDAGMTQAGWMAAAEVSALYEEWYWMQESLALADSMLSLYGRLKSIQDVRAEVGEELPFEQGLATTAYGQWNLKRLDYQRRQEDIRRQLQRLLGLESLPELPATGQRSREFSMSKEDIFASWAHTSAYQHLSGLVNQQQAVIQVEKLQQTPSVNLGYFTQTLDGITGFQGASIGLDFPLWVPAQRSKVQVQTAMRDEEILNRELAAQRFQEVADLYWREYEFRQDAMTFYQSEVLQEAENIRRVAEQRYRNGEMPFVEVLRLLAQTASWNQDYLEARYRLNLSIISLSYLIR